MGIRHSLQIHVYQQTCLIASALKYNIQDCYEVIKYTQ